MGEELRKIIYDNDLRLEGCYFQCVRHPFLPHFHEYYVIGLLEAGSRLLSCRDREISIHAGDLLLFGPGDTHGCCIRAGDGPLDYRSLHIPRQSMERLLPEPFAVSRNVISDGKLANRFRFLHEEIMGGHGAECREGLLLFLSALLHTCGGSSGQHAPEGYRQEIEAACTFLEAHFAEHITLERICRHVGLSKSTLLRAFTKSRGITPYRYLETLRISEAKKLLEQGIPPTEAALRTGFSDQSHFSRYFRLMIGLSPGAYRDIFTKTTKEKKER